MIGVSFSRNISAAALRNRSGLMPGSEAMRLTSWFSAKIIWVLPAGPCALRHSGETSAGGAAHRLGVTDTADFLPECPDPFAPARRGEGVLLAQFGGEAIPMILGHRAIRAAARDWETFSSNAPCRVPIPDERAVRSVRQLPIEIDPPLHKAWRDLLKPTFMRPVAPDYIARIDALVARLIDDAKAQEQIEVVREFALPLQSLALAHLLGMPESAGRRSGSAGAPMCSTTAMTPAPRARCSIAISVQGSRRLRPRRGAISLAR
jgi:cytochrome P450